jgi:hypothetical protein
MTVALVIGWNVPIMGLEQAIDVGFKPDAASFSVVLMKTPLSNGVI